MTTSVQHQIVELLKGYDDDEPNELAGFMRAMPPEKAIRVIFHNFRSGNGNPRGLRLSNHGLMIMKQYFQCYEIRFREGYRICARHLLYLDRIVKFPYYYAHEYLVLFESRLGVRLRLADGDIDTLMEVDRCAVPSANL